MGVGEQSANWFLSYLSGRKQSCIVDGQLSAPLDLPQCGVPQGSIGGPIMWLLFTCDQPDVIHNHTIDAQEVDRGCTRHHQAAEHEEPVEVGHGDQAEQAGHLVADGGGRGTLVGYVDDRAYSYASPDPCVLSQVLTDKYNKKKQSGLISENYCNKKA